MLRAAKGFTLLEIMVTMAIMAIVGTIAFAAYESQSRKGRRTEAIVALEQIAQAQQRFFTNENTFTASIADLKRYGIESGTSPGGHYTFTLAAGPDGLTSTFVATATPDGSQKKDSCTELSVSMTSQSPTVTRDGTPDSKTCWGN